MNKISKSALGYAAAGFLACAAMSGSAQAASVNVSVTQAAAPVGQAFDETLSVFTITISTANDPGSGSQGLEDFIGGIVFQFNNGVGTGDNFVIVGNFATDGVLPAPDLGAFTTDLGDGTFEISDGGQFGTGSTLEFPSPNVDFGTFFSFDVQFTQNPGTDGTFGTTPDTFALQFLNSGGTQLGTDDFAGRVVGIDITSEVPIESGDISVFGGTFVDFGTTGLGGTQVDLVPEPSPLLALLGFGCVAAATTYTRRRRLS